MDLHWIETEASQAEREAVDALLGEPERNDRPGPALEEHIVRGGLHDAKSKRQLLLPALHAVQDAVGWVSQGALGYICRRLDVPPAEAYGVVTFYSLLSTEPRPKRLAHVCDDIACKLQGADALCEKLGEELQPGAWRRSPCLGQCERGPAVFFQCAGSPAGC